METTRADHRSAEDLVYPDRIDKELDTIFSKNPGKYIFARPEIV